MLASDVHSSEALPVTMAEQQKAEGRRKLLNDIVIVSTVPQIGIIEKDFQTSKFSISLVRAQK
jgi:hypothetical protein